MIENPYIQALEFLVDAGVTSALMDEPHNRFENASHNVTPAKAGVHGDNVQIDFGRSLSPTKIGDRNDGKRERNDNTLKMHADVIAEAKKLANACDTLDDLKDAIQNFDGLSVKKTATQLVFADGNPDADIMVIGEAPGADEDRQGKPFVGVSGQLLDRIFACIDLNRQDSLYITNILNWRPPGNRTPTKEEMEIAFPFIQKHIALIKPKIIVLCGGVAAQTILQSKESISRLRGKAHDLDEGVKAIATYHPAFLLRTPIQKKKVWEDMIMLKGLIDNV